MTGPPAIDRPRTPARRPPNALGDLVRVAAQLRPGAPGVLARAAALLGLAPEVPAPEPSESRPPQSPLPEPTPAQAPAGRRWSGRDTEAGSAVRVGGDDPRPTRSIAAERLPASPLPPRQIRKSVTELLAEPQRGGPPAPARLEAELFRAELFRAELFRAELFRAELFRADHQRAIIAELAAVERPGAEIDIPRALDLLMNRRPIPEIPFTTTRTTRAGLDLLLDLGPSMQPFLRDLRLLDGRTRRVVGEDDVTAWRFSGTPNTVVALPDGEDEEPYRPPQSPRAVLVATDLGIATDSTPEAYEEWSAFARTVHAAGCPLILLVPYPPDRRPDWTAHRFAVVTWDRATEVGRARRAAHRAAALLRSPR
ncbi:hypothetical protein [Kitasatospora sp. NPDC093558]|uniref:hypothetical protein n=1 Tax=Kitasatospora sp. NPDC093558 TaxID=3155201 RepID=UPI003416DAD8